MNIEEIKSAERKELSAEQISFLDLHNEIIYSGERSADYFIAMCKSLARMKDSKLYEQAGYGSFGEYTEQALNIKERQAYNYISLSEKYSDEFLSKNYRLGVTKLILLSGLTESEREEIVSGETAEEMTVAELRKAISEKEEKIQQLEMSVSDKSTSINELNEKLKSVKSARDKRIEELNHDLEVLKSQPAKIEKVVDPEMEVKLERATKTLTEREEEIKELNAKIKILNNDALIRFKVKFNDLQAAYKEIIDIMSEMDEEIKTKCKEALKKVSEAYL